MATTTATNLSDLALALERHLGNHASFSAVSTRVLLRTGVSLRNPKPEQIYDHAVVARLSTALAEMGYRL
jgi:hypothetical protein